MEAITRTHFTYVAGAAAFALLMPPVVAQVDKSGLTGVVTDPSGAAIPGTQVTAVNSGTGARRQETTNETGIFRFALLDFGTYQVEVSPGGFKRFVGSGVVLDSGQITTVDVALEIGQSAESIVVTGESPLLRTEAGGIGATVDSKSVSELPIIGCNVFAYPALLPGVVPNPGYAKYLAPNMRLPLIASILRCAPRACGGSPPHLVASVR